MSKEAGRGKTAFPERYGKRELSPLYREIPLKDTAYRLLRKYCTAMAHLYGIIPLKKAWEIIEAQNPKLISEEQFRAFAEVARHEEEFFILKDSELFEDGKRTTWLNWKIYDPILFYDDQTLLHALKAQEGKEYYIPHKDELLQYSDSGYVEETPAAVKLWEFLTDVLKLEEEQASVLFTNLLVHTRCLYVGIDEMVDTLMPGLLDTEKKMQIFLKVFHNFANNSRMQGNRGFTPMEMVEQNKAKGIPTELTLGPGIRKMLEDGSVTPKEMRQMIMELPEEQEDVKALLLLALDKVIREKNGALEQPRKVGRNAPCPCGSGKKYKRCCGR